MSKGTMLQKPNNHGLIPRGCLNNSSYKKPLEGSFSATIDERMELIADLMLDKIERDRENGTLKFKPSNRTT